MAGDIIPIIFGLVVVIIILAYSIKIVKEYERGVIFRMGRLVGAKGPGMFFIIPIIDKWIKVDLRTIVFDIQKQNVITKDNISIMVDAVVYYRTENPCDAIVNVENYHEATVLRAETTIRDVLGQIEMDELLAKREELGKKIQEILDVATSPWGIKVNAVTIRDVLLPESMTRAMAKQAEAERERRSRIIMADGELQAAHKMKDAAEEYTKTPMAMKLRELQTLSEIAREKNLIVVPSGAIGANIGNIVGITEGIFKKDKVPERPEQK